MLFTDIREFTYIGNNVIVNGVDREVPTALDVTINAVQFHKGRDFHIEETDNGNTEVALEKYQPILDEWVSAEVIPTPPTQADIVNNLKQGIQAHIDAEAVSLGFDDINSISKYMVFDNVYKSDADSLANWTIDVWEYVESELVKMQNGDRTIPTLDEAIAELPIRV